MQKKVFYSLNSSKFHWILKNVYIFSHLKIILGWQDGAFFILVLAILLGFLGLSLSVAGHLVYALPKRLYYFHSGGEAHVVAGKSNFKNKEMVCVFGCFFKTCKQYNQNKNQLSFSSWRKLVAI